jgi:serine/threonine protein kinase
VTAPPPVIPSDLTNALSARYELRSILGRGGMATVYMAYDRKHLREVAVKVLRPEIAASLGAERFLTEIQTVARLTHPHILPLHDSGESEGFVYYVMPFIHGGSLRERLEVLLSPVMANLPPGEVRDALVARASASRPRDVGAALEVAAPVADALGYAHRKGVLHRDLKPENILFSEGHPIVADFGIAKAVSTASGRNLTRTGVALGTPGYMSPEQAAGFHELDERTDVYSLAVVVYEMIVGEIPGRWPSEDAVRAGRFLEANPLHRSRLSSCGATVEAALVRGLAVRPDQRTATPTALMDELRGVSAGVPRRRYRADEVDEIVKRAAELEISNPTESGALTIGGVEQIAAEAGLDPKHIRSAAASLSPYTTTGGGLAALQPAKPNKIIGGPTSITVERVVEGELDESEFPVLVDEIRRAMQNVGQVSQLGKSFSWTMARGRSTGREVEVAVIVRAGQTRIILQESLGNLIGGIFGGLGGGMGGGGLGPMVGLTVDVMHRPGALAFIIPAWLITTYSTARTWYHYASARRQRKLTEMIDRLAGVAAQLIGEARPKLPRR